MRIRSSAFVSDQPVVGEKTAVSGRARLGRHLVVQPGSIVPDDTILLDLSVVRAISTCGRPH